MQEEKIKLGLHDFVFHSNNWNAAGRLLTVMVAAGSLSFWDYLATEKGSS